MSYTDDGGPLADYLPPTDIIRWVPARKAAVLRAIDCGDLEQMRACRIYGISPEELDNWRKSIKSDGIPGLRVTRIQIYRSCSIRSSEKQKNANAR